jgi:hypothetical protein
MTSWTFGRNQQQQRILIAIYADFLNTKEMAGSFPLQPQFAARSRMKMRKTASSSFCQCLRIHECQHQHLPTRSIHSDGAYQALRVESRQKSAASLAVDHFGGTHGVKKSLSMFDFADMLHDNHMCETKSINPYDGTFLRVEI